MPKDEFDFDDPMELNGVALACEQDTTGEMADCFIEEFMRLGYNAKQILALFRNPHYVGMHLVVRLRGEAFVCERIAEIFARWGRRVSSPTSGCGDPAPPHESAVSPISPSAGPSPLKALTGADTPVSTLTDPTGAPIPDLTI